MGGGSYGRAKRAWNFFALTTPTLANAPTFHIHKLLEVVATLHADRSSIPNNAQCLPHGSNYIPSADHGEILIRGPIELALLNVLMKILMRNQILLSVLMLNLESN